jgi:hypothetical protein
MRNTAGVRSVQRWYTRDKTDMERRYVLNGRPSAIARTNTNHEDLTELSLDSLTARGVRFGADAREILVYWVAEVDRWKDARLSILARSFGELRALGSVRSTRPGQPSTVEQLLHAHGGASESDIGIVTAADKLGQLTGSGAIGALLDSAARAFATPSGKRHAIRLLGISLHALQDFYAHHFPLKERDLANGAQGCTSRSSSHCSHGPAFILEDDPALGPERWSAAKRRTVDQLERFWSRLSAADRYLLAGRLP